MEIYNTITRKKEKFVPVKEGEVGMYVCGPTVYDFLHVGNYRGAIFFNLVRNWFEKLGFKVTYVYNYTDVDDKIINRSKEEGTSCEEITKTYIGEFEKDYELLGLRPHTHNPRCTEYIPQMIKFIQELEEKGHAYNVDGDVYFAVESYNEYGKLTNKKLDELLSGTRVDVDSRKKHVSDFALWKSSKDGEPAWDSPWGQGRPGWHIECSAMSSDILGDTIDIHGGGLDLCFPHHENEIAQSEARSGKKFVNYWMHNNMLEFGNQKMSKSLGNVKTGRAFIEEYNGEILKFMILANHYRSTIDFSETQVNRSILGLAKFYSSLAAAQKLVAGGAPLVPVPDKFQEALAKADEHITKSLNDDFNTPEVMASFYEVNSLFNNLARRPGQVKPEYVAIAETYLAWLKDKGATMALFQEEPAQFLLKIDNMLLAKKGVERSDVDQLVKDRTSAREAKDWSKADEVRDKLKELGISVQDTAEGSTWEVDKSLDG